MKKIALLILLFFLTIPGRSQCAFEHEGNYTGLRPDFPPPFSSWITVSDSVTFTIHHFFDFNLFDDTIIGKINCADNSVQFLYEVLLFPTAVHEFWGVGSFSNDTLFANFTDVVWNQYGWRDTMFSQVIYKQIPVGIDSKNTCNSIHVYPNPTTNFFTVNLPNNEVAYEIHIYNLCGIETNFHSAKNIIDVHDFTNGIYLLSVRSHQGKKYSKLFIKK